MTTTVPAGREAQRRRTRRAIVDATMALLAETGEPSVGDIAARAEVSRRTVYLHFPTLDQLLLDATAGLMNSGVDAALEQVRSEDPRERLTALVEQLYATMPSTLPLGRKLIKLTVDAPDVPEGSPRRGYRRVRWLEWALEPVREQVPAVAFEQLVSALATVVGWEAFIVLLDVRALDPSAAREVTLQSALALLDTSIRTAAPGAQLGPKVSTRIRRTSTPRSPRAAVIAPEKRADPQT